MARPQSAFEKMLGEADETSLRAYYETTRTWMQSERATWDPHWLQLARFALPRSPRFNYSNVDTGYRRDGDIVDNTATLGLRVLSAGMMGGITAPTREWFVMSTDDPSVNDLPEVQEYLEMASDIIRRAMLKGNLYPTLHNYYRELALYGTSSFSILEDEIDGFRCYERPLGSYYISAGADRRIDFNLQMFDMPARDIVDRYGYDNCSSAIQAYYDSPAGGQKEQWRTIVHAVHKSLYYGKKCAESGKYKPWVSVAYELENLGNEQKKVTKLLSRGGYLENPVITTRWEVTGENFYGNSPGMDALGDIMGLQLNEKRITEATDKMVKPPMVASPTLANGTMSILPGGITFADTRDGNPGFKPAFQMQFDTRAASDRSQLMRDRINEAMFKTLFLMISGSDRREVTAEEIRAKQEEKMLVLGPVLERINEEGLKPIIHRIFPILRRNGMIPPPPEILRGRPVVFGFETILAQAQRLLKIANIDRLYQFIGTHIPTMPEMADTVNATRTVADYAKDLSVQPGVLSTPQEIAAIRKQRAQQQQQASMADNAQKMAGAAQALSNSDTSSNNALTHLLGNVGQ